MEIIQGFAAFSTVLLGIISFFLVRLVNSIDRNEQQQEEMSRHMEVYIAQNSQIVASLEEARKDHEERLRSIEKRLPARKKTVNKEAEGIYPHM